MSNVGLNKEKLICNGCGSELKDIGSRLIIMNVIDKKLGNETLLFCDKPCVTKLIINGASDEAFLKDAEKEIRSSFPGFEKGLEEAYKNKIIFGSEIAQVRCHACGCSHAGYTCEEFLTKSAHEHE